MSDLTRLRRTFRDDLGEDDAVLDAMVGAIATFAAPPAPATVARHIAAIVAAPLEHPDEPAPVAEPANALARFAGTLLGKAAVVSVALVASTSGAAAAGMLGDSAKGFVSDVTGGIVAEPSDDAEEVGAEPEDVPVVAPVGASGPQQPQPAAEVSSPPAADEPEPEAEVVDPEEEREDQGEDEEEEGERDDEPSDEDVEAIEDESDPTDELEERDPGTARRAANELDRLDKQPEPEDRGPGPERDEDRRSGHDAEERAT